MSSHYFTIFDASSALLGVLEPDDVAMVVRCYIALKGFADSLVANHASPPSLFNGKQSPAGAFPEGMLTTVASSFRRSVIDLWRRLVMHEIAADERARDVGGHLGRVARCDGNFERDVYRVPLHGERHARGAHVREPPSERFHEWALLARSGESDLARATVWTLGVKERCVAVEDHLPLAARDGEPHRILALWYWLTIDRNVLAHGKRRRRVGTWRPDVGVLNASAKESRASAARGRE